MQDKSHIQQLVEGGAAFVLLALLALLAYAIGRYILLPLLESRKAESAKLWEALDRKEDAAKADRDAYATSLQEIREGAREDNQRLAEAIGKLTETIGAGRIVERLERVEELLGQRQRRRPQGGSDPNVPATR